MKKTLAVMFIVLGIASQVFAQGQQDKNIWRNPSYSPPSSPPPVFSIIGEVKEYEYDLLENEKRLVLYLWTIPGSVGYGGSSSRDVFLTIHNVNLPSGLKLQYGKSYRFVFEGYLEKRIVDKETYDRYKDGFPEWGRGTEYRIIVGKLLSIDEVERNGKNWRIEFRAPAGVKKQLGFDERIGE